MGVLWEVLQSGFIYHQKTKNDTIEERVAYLEEELQRTQTTMRELVKKIEEIHGMDIDGNGQVG